MPTIHLSAPLADADEVREFIRCRFTQGVSFTERKAWFSRVRFTVTGPDDALQALQQRVRELLDERSIERLTW